MRVDPASREAAVARLLDRWPWELGGVVIGGYAVAAYGRPRYSTDVDVVLSLKAFHHLDKWLVDQGFARDPLPENLEQNYAGRGFRYELGEMTVDLLPGVVRDREARVDVPEGWVARDPLRRRLFLLEASTQREIPVCRVEAFWALKLQAGREKDLSDLFAIRDERLDAADLQSVFRAIRAPSLDAKLRAVLKRLDEPKVFAGAMSRLALSRRGQIDRDAEWRRFATKVRAVVEPILLD